MLEMWRPQGNFIPYFLDMSSAGSLLEANTLLVSLRHIEVALVTHLLGIPLKGSLDQPPVLISHILTVRRCLISFFWKSFLPPKMDLYSRIRVACTMEHLSVRLSNTLDKFYDTWSLWDSYMYGGEVEISFGNSVSPS